VSVIDQDIGDLIDDYKDHEIDGLIVDLSRIKDVEIHQNKQNELMDLIS
jgi:hypothetical protein